ncbi:hypothetical protein [Streptomyces sp. bgisy034]|uniref:hypothetical protein n=1 Tax=Streptomyces sp. bgisy034 TaxID=3413774 RepID=UPI003EB6F80D
MGGRAALMLAGEPAPTGPARRGAKPPVFPLAAIDDPAPPEAPGKAPAGTPMLDVCPETGRARHSHRRAEEIEDIEDLDGFTLHRLRHSALTHDAEGGTSPDAAGPFPPRLRPLPGAVRPPRRRRGRPARRGA